MGTLIVKPGHESIKNNRVALSDNDLVHAESDKRWELGLFIAGDSENPGATYKVADTATVREAIKAGRLELVKESASAGEPTPHKAPEVAPEKAPEEPKKDK